MSTPDHQAKPQKVITITDAVAFCVGVVVGIGIFRMPPLVAANTPDETMFIVAWLLGGLAMLIGMLCYAELASAHPHAGGEYHFLRLAYGQRLATLFAWARCTVIQTGAIALVAFVFGDYAQQVIPLGPYGPTIWAAISIIALTGVNLVGTPPGKRVQIGFAIATVTLVCLVIVVGILSPGANAASAPAAASTVSPFTGAFGLAMVFVLLTFGGWNEIAYLSGEMRDPRREMLLTAIIGTAVVTALYVAVNMTYLHLFGMQGLAQSKAIGADFMRHIAGDTGAIALSVIICCAALSTLNATIFTGARVYYALGNDIPMVRRLGVWSEQGDNPPNAFLLQAALSLALVGFGGYTRDGFSAMVDYTAPVFWAFLLLTALSLFILRFRPAAGSNVYRVHLYPLTPAIFVAMCAYLLYASINYTGSGALIGLAVLALGLPLAIFATTTRRPEPEAAQ
jgi:basic amino acid/polyamine antiporter, APA family